MTAGLLAQAPDFFHYQAVLRNGDGSPRSMEQVSVTVEMVQGSVDGDAVYLENHQVETDPRGVVILKIGDGTFFNEIRWDDGPYFLRLSVNGNPIGTSQLLSVPYALYARQAGNVDDDDPDPTNELQQLTLEGSELEISGGNSVTLPDVVTPWIENEQGIHYYQNVGIGFGAREPSYPLDIVKDLFGSQENIMLRLQNRDESARAAAGIALEAYRDKLEPSFYRSELIQTSSYYARYPDFGSMTGLIAEGNGISLCSKSPEGSLRLYTTTVRDTIIERARMDPQGRLGIGTSTPEAKLHVADGDIYLEDVNSGILMRSSDGQLWRIRIDNTGNLVSAPAEIE